jgi:hypothetical protein
MPHSKPHRIAYYLHRVLAFLWSRDSRFVLLLIATGLVFSGLWYIDVLRPVLVPVGAALAAFFGAAPGFMTGSTKAKVTSALVASILVGVGTWYTTFDLEHEKKTLQTRLNLLQTAFSDYGKELNQEQRAALVLKLARISRQRFNEKQFDHVEDLSNLILQQLPDNGHGLYYSGEVWRVRKDREDMRGEFNRYRSIESNLPPTERDGEANVCYQRSNGFCGERTAWIDHMMANDFYKSAVESKDVGIKTAALRSSCNFLQESMDRLNHLPLEHFPHGFDASTSFLSTQDLEMRLPRELLAAGIGDACAMPTRPVTGP